MAEQRAFLIFYDIADPKRLRCMARILEGYGYRVQESVFYCKLSMLMKTNLRNDIAAAINKQEDQCIIVDLGTDVDTIRNFDTIGKSIPSIPKIIFI